MQGIHVEISYFCNHKCEEKINLPYFIFIFAETTLQGFNNGNAFFLNSIFTQEFKVSVFHKKLVLFFFEGSLS